MQPQLQLGTEISRFRVESLIARGGMGVVYRALDQRLNRPVALKLLAPELSDNARFRDRFVRESRLAAAVDHPNIIPIYEADEWNGLLYIAMRFVRGVDLHTALVTEGPLDVDVALRDLSQAASALDAAHAVSLVHRDVKPGNIMVASKEGGRGRADGHVYLTDFGLTKRSTSLSGFTTAGNFLGTLDYVAPEQIRGDDVDARTDLYALACVAFEMLTGEPPFVREQDSAILWAHMNVDPPSVTAARPDLPTSVDAVLARGMAKVPDERQSSCGELVAQMAEALELDGGPSGTQSAPPVHRDEDARGSGAPPPDPAPASGGNGTTGLRPAGADAPPVDRGPAPSPEPFAEPVTLPRARRRPLWWIVAAVVLLVAALVLGLWRPWGRGPELVAKDLGDSGFVADVPRNWQPWPATETETVLAPVNWSGVFIGDPGALEQAATAARQRPESLVGLYVAAPGLDATTPAQQREQLEASFLGSTISAADETMQVAGRDASTFEGTLRLGSGDSLHLHVRLLGGQDSVLFVFFAPDTVDSAWMPVFEQVTDSIRQEG